MKKRRLPEQDAPIPKKSISRCLPGIRVTVQWYTTNWDNKEMEIMSETITEWLQDLLDYLPEKKKDFYSVFREHEGVE